MGVWGIRALLVAAALAGCIPASAAEEIISNGGFETGELAPWTAETFGIMYGGKTGRYHAGFCFYTSKWVKDSITQDLGRTISPGEVAKVCFWAYGGTIGEEEEHQPAELIIFLGNNRYEDFLEIYINFWEYKEFPLGQITEPFNYTKIKISIYARYRALYRGGVDDVSILLKPTGVEPTSLGRVKAMYR